MFNRAGLYYVLRQRGCLDPEEHIIEMLNLDRHLWCKATPEHLRPALRVEDILADIRSRRGEPC